MVLSSVILLPNIIAVAANADTTTEIPSGIGLLLTMLRMSLKNITPAIEENNVPKNIVPNILSLVCSDKIIAVINIATSKTGIERINEKISDRMTRLNISPLNDVNDGIIIRLLITPFIKDATTHINT